MALRSAAERQRELVLDILQVFTEGSEGSRKRTAGVREIVDRSVELFEPVARARGQTLSWDPLPWSEVRVVGDPSRLERVVSNLLDDGVRYALSTVNVVAALEEDFVRIAVEDDGPEVPEELTHNLFTRLGRWRGSRGDMGVGLYFCRITVEQAGGTVGYDRRRGGGARFWVRLPRAPATAARAT